MPEIIIKKKPRYWNRIKENKHEAGVQKYFLSLGYNSLARGWPDFLFIKGHEVIFIEVKRPNQNGIKPHQRAIRNVFKKLGLDYRVIYGMKDGKPNYK